MAIDTVQDGRQDPGIEEASEEGKPKKASNGGIQSHVKGEKRELKSLEPLLTSPRCGAKTKAGGACRAPAMANKRCRKHGGRAGAPAGNLNALRHGRYAFDPAEFIRHVNRRALRIDCGDAHIVLKLAKAWSHWEKARRDVDLMRLKAGQPPLDWETGKPIIAK